MVQTDQTAQTAEGFPYGIDPRDYGLGRLDYDRALRHHRQMEHSDRMAHEHTLHMNTMEEERARKAAADAELAARYWWLQPINSLFKWCGGAFWLAMWIILISSVLVSISEWQQKRDAQWCLKDVAKCEAIAKGVKP